MTFLYNLALFFLFLLFLPKALQKKYRSSFAMRLGRGIPTIDQKKRVIWMHAVSVGEVKALASFILHIPASYVLVVSTTTQTGLAEARRLFPHLEASFLIPFDFSWIMKKVMNKIHPEYFILCESDFWFHALKFAKEQGAKTALINGKISIRSCRRFAAFPFFTKRLFSYLDHLFLQNEEYRSRFLQLPIAQEKLSVTGNLKLDTPIVFMTKEEKQVLRAHLGIKETDPVLVIGSTHDPEEDQLLTLLTPLWQKYPSLKILLVPRHPERFSLVSALLTKKGWNHSRFSQENPCHERLILVDAMGILNQCYQVATLAIVAGSYTDKVGGHNVFEPVQYGTPVFFGPFMYTQSELKELVCSAHAGKEVSLSSLFQETSQLLSSEPIQLQFKICCDCLVKAVQGSSQKTSDLIFKTF